MIWIFAEQHNNELSKISLDFVLVIVERFKSYMIITTLFSGNI